MALFLPAVCCGFIPTPSSVIIAEVAGGTLNSSAANFNTAVKGVASGTLNLEFYNKNANKVQLLYLPQQIQNS